MAGLAFFDRVAEMPTQVEYRFETTVINRDRTLVIDKQTPTRMARWYRMCQMRAVQTMTWSASPVSAWSMLPQLPSSTFARA